MKTGAGLLMWHEDDIHMSDEVKAYYESLARGGVGLLIVESPTVDYPRGARWRERYRIDDDKYIEGLKELVEVIHRLRLSDLHADEPRRPLAGEAPRRAGAPLSTAAYSGIPGVHEV